MPLPTIQPVKAALFVRLQGHDQNELLLGVQPSTFNVTRDSYTIFCTRLKHLTVRRRRRCFWQEIQAGNDAWSLSQMCCTLLARCCTLNHFRSDGTDSLMAPFSLPSSESAERQSYFAIFTVNVFCWKRPEGKENGIWSVCDETYACMSYCTCEDNILFH